MIPYSITDLDSEEKFEKVKQHQLIFIMELKKEKIVQNYCIKKAKKG
jgi:hypothetical protein